MPPLMQQIIHNVSTAVLYCLPDSARDRMNCYYLLFIQYVTAQPCQSTLLIDNIGVLLMIKEKHFPFVRILASSPECIPLAFAENSIHHSHVSSYHIHGSSHIITSLRYDRSTSCNLCTCKPQPKMIYYICIIPCSHGCMRQPNQTKECWIGQRSLIMQRVIMRL